MLYKIAIAALLLLCIVIPVRKKYRYVLTLLVCITVFLLFLPTLRLNHLLAKSGVQHVGVLIKKNCERANAPYIEYRFTVNKEDIVGSGRPGRGNQSCESFQIGDQVFITYLPGNEAINRAEREVESSVFAPVAGFFALYIVLILLGNSHEKFRNKKSVMGGKSVIRTRPRP